MEVSEEKWISLANENIFRYMDRGGTDKGDDPQILSGAEFLNTIGIALNVEISDPTQWNKQECKDAEEGNFCFFKGKSLEAINVVAEKIYDECGGDKKNFITVLPIALYYENKLYSLALFRFKRYASSSWNFVDNIGRVYSTFSDWTDNNRLPPGQVMYPKDGNLIRKKGACYRETPSASVGATVLKVTDISAGLVGIGSAIGATFLTGGLALPFIIAGVATAGYSTARSAHQIYDRGSHSESINPFGSVESLTLWLGIGANVISFGAMGATWRLSSLAFRGKNITDGFKLFVNVVNGTSLTVNSVAMLNSLVFMAMHFDDMSPVDILMQVASIAFWAKSAFTYQSAGKIIKNIHNQALEGYSRGLAEPQKNEFNNLRKNYANDQLLVKMFYEGIKNGFDPTRFSQLLIDVHNEGNLLQLGINFNEGKLLYNGQVFSFEYMAQLSPNDRQAVIGILAQLSQSQSEAFGQIREHIQDDTRLFSAIILYSKHLQRTTGQVTHDIIDYWIALGRQGGRMPRLQLSSGDGTLVVGNGYSIPIAQLRQYLNQPRIMALMSNELFQLSHDDINLFNQLRLAQNNDLKLLRWIDETNNAQTLNTVSTLLNLHRIDSGGNMIFTMITDLVPNGIKGYGSIQLCNKVNISIYFLAKLKLNALSELLQIIRTTNVDIKTGYLNFKEIQGYKIKSEHNRKQALDWFKLKVTANRSSCDRINFDEIRPHGADRLHATKFELRHLPPDVENKIRQFAFEMNPNNVSEFVAYNEFAYSYFNNEIKKFTVEDKEHWKSLRLGGKYNAWQKTTAAERMSFIDMKAQFMKLMEMAKNENMFGLMEVSRGLTDNQLMLTIIKNVNNGHLIRFGSQVSAAYHIYKRPGENMSLFVIEANNLIKDANNIQRNVSVMPQQEGSSRSVNITTSQGDVFLLEADGRVLLCSYIKKNSA